MRVAIFSAFPQEIKPIVKNLKAIKSKSRPFSLFVAEYSSKEIILVQSGMGRRNAETALDYVLKEHNPDLVLSAGFGGALYDGAAAGDLIWAERVFLIPEDVLKSGATLNRKDLCSQEIPNVREIVSRLSGRVSMREGCILTLEKYMKKSEIKKILPDDLCFTVCDMETFFLAKPSIQRGLPFISIRSITDRADEEIPFELFHVTDESGGYRLSRALSLLLRKPKLIRHSIKLGRNASIASKNLWLAVKSLIEVL